MTNIRQKPVTIHPYANGIFTDMQFATTAVPAMPTGDMPFAGHTVADVSVTDSASFVHHFSHVFMPDDHRGVDGLLRPSVPQVNMQVGTTNGRFPDLMSTSLIPIWGMGLSSIQSPRSGLDLTSAFIAVSD
jgi:hypothetical protein